MISANQLYKQSGSNKPFKTWLKETQEKGILQNHEKMFNLIDSPNEGSIQSSKSTTTQDAKTKLGMVNVLGFVGLALILYGLSRTSAE